MRTGRGPGRPSAYTEAVADEILARLAEGETLLEICRDDHLPSRPTVHQWVIDDHEGFSAKYARARSAQLERMADEIVSISDDGSNDWMLRQVDEDRVERIADHEHIQRSKLRVDTRKWLLAKLAAHTYGDKVGIEHSGGINLGLDEEVGADIGRIFGVASASVPADEPDSSGAVVSGKADRGRKARARKA